MLLWLDPLVREGHFVPFEIDQRWVGRRIQGKTGCPNWVPPKSMGCKAQLTAKGSKGPVHWELGGGATGSPGTWMVPPRQTLVQEQQHQCMSVFKGAPPGIKRRSFWTLGKKRWALRLIATILFNHSSTGAGVPPARAKQVKAGVPRCV